ncbi:hypothetical protein RB213_001129 [Colletotrichum asianum]
MSSKAFCSQNVLAPIPNGTRDAIHPEYHAAWHPAFGPTYIPYINTLNVHVARPQLVCRHGPEGTKDDGGEVHPPAEASSQLQTGSTFEPQHPRPTSMWHSTWASSFARDNATLINKGLFRVDIQEVLGVNWTSSAKLASPSRSPWSMRSLQPEQGAEAALSTKRKCKTENFLHTIDQGPWLQ